MVTTSLLQASASARNTRQQSLVTRSHASGYEMDIISVADNAQNINGGGTPSKHISVFDTGGILTTDQSKTGQKEIEVFDEERVLQERIARILDEDRKLDGERRERERKEKELRERIHVLKEEQIKKMKAERQSRLEMMLDREARLKSHLFQKINEDS